MIAENLADKQLDQSTRILKLIRKNNKYGVPNYMLSSISLKYSSRIAELRQDGHNIIAVRDRLPNRRASNVWRYFLVEEPLERGD
jgi:hypothetical protein